MSRKLHDKFNEKHMMIEQILNSKGKSGTCILLTFFHLKVIFCVLLNSQPTVSFSIYSYTISLQLPMSFSYTHNKKRYKFFFSSFRFWLKWHRNERSTFLMKCRLARVGDYVYERLLGNFSKIKQQI